MEGGGDGGGGGGGGKTLPKKPKMIADAKKDQKKKKTPHPPVCNSEAIIARIALIYLKVRGGQVVFWMLNISEVLQASNSILKLRRPPLAHSKLA